jgi:nucleoside-diphosphate-sugar epimerase
VALGATAPTRDLLYVADTAAAFIAAAEAPAAAVVGTVLNAGTGREISIGDLAVLIAQLMGRTLSLAEEAERLRPDRSEVMRLLADATRLRELTGWAPTRTLEQGLAETIEWFSRPENLAGYRTEQFAL